MIPLTVEIPESTAPLAFSAAGVALKGVFAPPVCRPAVPEAPVWTHRGRAVREMAQAGRPGTVTQDAFATVTLARGEEEFCVRRPAD